jgi:cytidine deaminase
MNFSQLTNDEESLVIRVQDCIQVNRRPGRVSAAAGVLTTSGRMHFGLDLISRKSSICAEPSALASAFLSRELGISTITAACISKDLRSQVVISPCGACRELIWFHAPDARIVITHMHQLVAVLARDLFKFGELYPSGHDS